MRERVSVVLETLPVFRAYREGGKWWELPKTQRA